MNDLKPQLFPPQPHVTFHGRKFNHCKCQWDLFFAVTRHESYQLGEAFLLSFYKVVIKQSGQFDSLVVWQGRDVERLSGTRAQGDRVGLLLGHEGGSMRLVHIQTEGGGQTVRHHERQVLQSLQLTGLLVANLQSHGVVPFLQLQGILWGQPDRRERIQLSLLSAHKELICLLLIHNQCDYSD